MNASIIEAVNNGDLSSLKLLLSTKCRNLNTPVDGAGTTLLHMAANSTVNVLRYLVENGANVSCQTEDGLSPLHVAAMWGKQELVRMLLDYGADPSICDSEGLIPANHARNKGYHSCAELLESGDFYEEIAPLQNDSMAETFVDTFQNLEFDKTLTELPDGRELPDVVEDTFHESRSLLLDTCTIPSPSLPNQSSKALSQTVEVLSPTVSPSSSSEGLSTLCNTTTLSQSVLDCSFSKEIQVMIPSHIRKLSDSELVKRLISFGKRPGPITESTRETYLVYLTKLEAGVQPKSNSGFKGFKYELALVLNGAAHIPDLRVLEEEFVKQFSTLQNVCRSSKTEVRDNFIYLLSDPRELSSLETTSPLDLIHFRKFMESVFYIGKGKNSRPVQHLKDAKHSLLKGKTTTLSSKLSRIADVWRAGCGVISLPLFHNTIDGEAFTRESCMIDAIGLDNLTNKVKGHAHGDVRQWTVSKRRQFGTYLLHKAFQVYKLTSPPEIRQNDI